MPFLGEIRMFAGDYAPSGWAFCNGQLLPITNNEDLFELLGTTYGGDGVENFALPDLRGRLPVHVGTGPDGRTFLLGEMGGAEQVTLTADQLPPHTHEPVGTTGQAFSRNPAGLALAAGAMELYTPSGAPAGEGLAVAESGGNQPHSNMQPFHCIEFIISLFGVSPQPPSP